MSFGMTAASYLSVVETQETYSIFDGQPSIPWQADFVEDGISVGTEFRVSQAAWVTHVRYLAGHGGGNDGIKPETSYCTIFESTDGGATATMLFTPLEMPYQQTVDEWVTLELPLPQQVQPPHTYMVVVWHPVGLNSYIATGGYFASGDFLSGQDVVKGPLIIPSAASSLHQGAYHYGAQVDAYPTDSYNGAAYYSDILLVTEEPGN